VRPAEFVYRVREGLGELRRRDPDAERNFGAKRHAYRLHPVARDSAVARFERKHAIELPLDYRAFLTEAGNGGAGPFYGVFALGEMDHNFDFKRWKVGEHVGMPSRCFAHRAKWNLSATTLKRLQASEDDTEILRLYWLRVDGAIPICHEGCALRDWLVVTGRERGHVWHDATADFRGWFPWPCDSRGTRSRRPLPRSRPDRMTFSEWYLDWLERALAASRHEMRGGRG
jgi:hypothetical protein